eukprot:CAMPEP_0118942684 /NCGR_PEP_ID=MMETSP1169-20130426/36633_1 /TAXON_ID=36882 /ORGANISM="Pyramimonas obovata, Strain CCMP722" /LENGTH=69 /DNA_ID=CAMNT_0006887739 /DNA_START=92 /DNA_END=298 /DNA_ORIENTATION=+
MSPPLHAIYSQHSPPRLHQLMMLAVSDVHVVDAVCDARAAQRALRHQPRAPPRPPKNGLCALRARRHVL